MALGSFLDEYNACTGDDELKNHLKLMIDDGTVDGMPLLTSTRLLKPGQIRLLTLHPGTIGDEIKTTLQLHDITSAPKYVALSYTWGDKSRTLPIQCDNCTARIPITLYSALVRIRKVEEEMTIWVDALCINQAEDDTALAERASQVRMMDRIFSTAEKVIINLGGATKDDTDGFMRGYQHFQKVIWKGPSYPVVFERDKPNVEFGPKDPFWDSWRHFLLRPWVSRVWVIQELVLARKAVMLLGTVEIDPLELGRVMPQVVFHFGSLCEDVPTQILNGGTIDMKRSRDRRRAGHAVARYSNMLRYHGMHQKDGTKQEFTEILDMSRDMATTDIRDHIFALAGVVKDWEKLNIVIDYTTSSTDLRVTVAKALITSGNVFYCLSRAAGINISMLTWMPFLEDKNNGDSDEEFMGIHHILYSAAGSIRCQARVTESSALEMKGFLLDTVVDIAPVPPVLSNVTRLMSDLQGSSLRLMQWYSSIKRWARQASPGQDTTMIKHRLWRAMLLDVVDDLERMPPTKSRATISTLQKQFKMIEESYEYQTQKGNAKGGFRYYDYSQADSDSMGHVYNACIKRKICRTRNGRFANIPPKAVLDNEIWILYGIPLPMVLRNLGNTHVIVGPAYLEGMMDGEALKMPDWKERIVTIV